ncbi:MAG: hypothetical protein ACRC1T_05230 [Clostridium chrysemydis]|uniref:hypothetical protein n=1 Tax=Clostridium chrysemydis TaxID=2665504 RepID=UPI003F310775
MIEEYDLKMMRENRAFDIEQIQMNRNKRCRDKLKEACWSFYLEIIEEFRYKKERDILYKIKNNEIKHIEEIELLVLDLEKIDRLILNEEIGFGDYLDRINNIISEMKMDIEESIDSEKKYENIWELIEESKIDLRNIDNIEGANINHFLKMNKLFLELDIVEKQYLRYEWNQKMEEIKNNEWKIRELVDFLSTKDKDDIDKFISWIVVQGEEMFNTYMEEGIHFLEEYMEQYGFTNKNILRGGFGGIFKY